MHAGTAEPLRVSPPEAVAYLLELPLGEAKAPKHRQEAFVDFEAIPSGRRHDQNPLLAWYAAHNFDAFDTTQRCIPLHEADARSPMLVLSVARKGVLMRPADWSPPRVSPLRPGERRGQYG